MEQHIGIADRNHVIMKHPGINQVRVLLRIDDTIFG